MGDLSASEGRRKKKVMSKSNNKWITRLKSEFNSIPTTMNTNNLVIDEDPYEFGDIKKENDTTNADSNSLEEESQSESTMQDTDPLLINYAVKTRERRRSSVNKSETPEERAVRLAKMSAYAAKRLANETPQQRSSRLKRMSEYAAKRLAQETSEQRAKRLARMSAYAAKRLATETAEQRQARLSRMSAYAIRRQAMKKTASSSQDCISTHSEYSLANPFMSGSLS